MSHFLGQQLPQHHHHPIDYLLQIADILLEFFFQFLSKEAKPRFFGAIIYLENLKNVPALNKMRIAKNEILQQFIIQRIFR